MSEFNRLCLSAGIPNPMLLFVGGGNMASALINGCVKSDFMTATEIGISCRTERTYNNWKSQGFTNVFVSTADMIKRFPHGILVLAVKPHSRHEVFDSIVSKGVSLGSCPIVISILAGISTTVLQKELSAIGCRGPLIRLMPNTAAAIGASASIFTVPHNTTVEMMEIVENLASKVGMCLDVDSKNFNAYATLAGSAPAWAYMFIESLADGGVLAGCSRETALKLAAQSVMGAAQMVLATDKHPASLKDKICSPGGTTISGLRKLEEFGFRSAVIEAVIAATDRANSMS